MEPMREIGRSSSHRKSMGPFVAVLLVACCAILGGVTTPARAFGQDTIDIVTGTGCMHSPWSLLPMMPNASAG
jgi:hypothetical protein